MPDTPAPGPQAPTPDPAAPTPEPAAPMPEVVTLDLDDDGFLTHPDHGGPVHGRALPGVLDSALHIPRTTTDIVVFAHGWRTPPDQALSGTRRLAADSERLLARNHPGKLYPALPEHHGAYWIAVRWKSEAGYRKARARAHSAATQGHAADVLTALLGYFDRHRTKPTGAEVWQNAAGQYLHCVGHSFGGRFLCQAVQEAGPDRAAKHVWYGPVRRDPRYPHTVDSLLVFQMAARPDVFAPGGTFAPLLADAPISGPVTLTHSGRDRATGLAHLLAERRRGIGTVGVRRGEDVHRVDLHAPEVPYTEQDLKHALVNVDASKLFRGDFWSATGGHSDIWHPHSAHLLLSLMDHAREAVRG